MTAKLSVFVLLAGAVLAQNPPPRDAAPQTAPEQLTGTGRIAGVIVAADNGTPVKRVTVSVVRTGPSPGERLPASAVTGRGRGTVVITAGVVGGVIGGAEGPSAKITDEAGRFDQSELAAGTYMIMVRPQSGFVAPTRPERVTLKDGQTVNLTIKLERTGAITGRILDESGDPLPRTRVMAARAASPGGPAGMGGSATTDDLGQFRLFDLPPGEYYVSATSTQPFANEPVGSPGHATTYYPGAAARDQAQRVVVKSGQDTPNVDFSLLRVAMGRITGTLRDANGQLVTFDPRSGRGGGPMANVMLGAASIDAANYTSSRGASIKPDGTFVIGGIAPGNYYLSASITRGQGPEADREGVFVPVTVNGDEQHVDLRTNLGATISGRVVVEGTPPPMPANITIAGGLGRQRVSIRPVPGTPSAFRGGPDAGQVNDDGEFELSGVRGRVYLSIMATGSAVLKSITYGADDISAKPVELKGTERLRNVVITLTHDSGRIQGTVTIDGTTPAKGALVVAFPDDPERWFQGSPFVSVMSTTSDIPPEVLAQRPPGAPAPPAPGSIMGRPLLPGRYFVIALEGSGGGFSPPRDPAEFEKLKKEATAVTVNAGVVTTVQLRVQKP